VEVLFSVLTKVKKNVTKTYALDKKIKRLRVKFHKLFDIKMMKKQLGITSNCFSV
jgi:hypothetical protein